jgi:N-acyl-D-amino-acid deacylase
MKKLIPITLWLLCADVCRAEYELLLNDGVKLTWDEYTVEDGQYCTQKSFGKFCVQKKDVVSLKQAPGGAGDAPTVNRAGGPAREKPAGPKYLAGLPVTGQSTPGVEQLDEVMVRYVNRIGCTAATLAVSDHGVTVHSRGYGWSDRDKKVPTQPDTLIGIASCEKPVTAAAIRRLAREGKLGLDAGLFEFLKVKPQGPVVDRRMMQITIKHLLEHKAGWGADPASEAAEVARKKGFQDPIPIDSKAWIPDPSKNPIPMETFLGFVMTQKLKNQPGAKSEYCNFGYDTLRRVITKVTGRSYIEYFRQELFRPDVIREFKAHDMPRKKDGPPLVWNAETGGLSASAPALLRFMKAYWLTGEPRDNGNPLWIMYGSLPGSTAIMVWRPDGADIVALFNGRSSVTHDEIRKDLEEVIERLKQQ